MNTRQAVQGGLLIIPPEDMIYHDALDVLPSDSATRLVFADWLADHGNHSLARAQRWLVARGLYPASRVGPQVRKPWAWWHDRIPKYEVLGEGALTHAMLPRLTFLAMASTYSYTMHHYYLTRPHAELALANALDRLEAELGACREKS